MIHRLDVERMKGYKHSAIGTPAKHLSTFPASPRSLITPCFTNDSKPQYE